MRTHFCTVITLVLTLAGIAAAEPAINIYADSALYQPGDSIEISLSAENDDEAMSVDVYVGIILPDGEIWSLQPDGWSSSISPWLESEFVPASLEMTPTPILAFGLPSEEPPLIEPGYYSLAAVLTYPGTLE
ncbi:MAG: hypothetical protein JW941_08095 [Candidatus Coatesbacteria bacterium]|nr:hypothetical protein [Candidatus Coatesbacteria bacterium]